VSLAYATSGCGGGPAKAPAEASPVAAAPADTADAPLPPPAYESGLPEGVRDMLFKPFTGDLDQMVARRLVRVGVTYNRTFYFVDRGVQRGASYELGQAFEDHLNKKLKTKNATKVLVAFVPLPRDVLASALVEGKVDLVAAQVTVRPELQALADFTNPTRTNVSEVVVTGPGSPAIASVDDLSGKDVYARKDSAPWQSLVALNQALKAKGRPPVAIREAPGNLEDEDLLEMVNAGLIPISVVDDYLAEFWKKILTNITVHDSVALRGACSAGSREGRPEVGRQAGAAGVGRPRQFPVDFHREGSFGPLYHHEWIASGFDIPLYSHTFSLDFPRLTGDAFSMPFDAEVVPEPALEPDAEPGSLVLFGGGLVMLLLAGIIRRKEGLQRRPGRT
jgi:ABC-type amino acid transport substrate-binding protein